MATAKNAIENAWSGTPFAYIKKEEDKTLVMATAYAEASIAHRLDAGLLVKCLHLRTENARLMKENEVLKAKVAAMQATNSAEEFLEIREIPREQAKEEIRAFFKDRHGEAIYPSDIMEALSLDYDLVYEICEELEKEGMVKGL
jgi:hypothetical protein